MGTFSCCNSGRPPVSSSPLFHGQLWPDQDVICVSANTAEHEGDEGQCDCLIDQMSFLARDKARPNVEFAAFSTQARNLNSEIPKVCAIWSIKFDFEKIPNPTFCLSPHSKNRAQSVRSARVSTVCVRQHRLCACIAGITHFFHDSTQEPHHGS